jgi:hypothetical protein
MYFVCFLKHNVRLDVLYASCGKSLATIRSTNLPHYHVYPLGCSMWGVYITFVEYTYIDAICKIYLY